MADTLIAIRECITESYFTGEERIEDALNEVHPCRRHQTLESAVEFDARVFAQEPSVLTALKYYKVTITIEEVHL